MKITDEEIDILERLVKSLKSNSEYRAVGGIKKLIAHYQSTKDMYWRSVKDELPPIGKEVICYGRHFNGTCNTVLASRLAGDTKEGWKYTHTCFYVDYWQPLTSTPITKGSE